MKTKKKKPRDYPPYYLHAIGSYKRHYRNSKTVKILVFVFFILSILLVKYFPEIMNSR